MKTSRNWRHLNLPILFFTGVTSLASMLVQAQSIEPGAYYRLSSQWQGEGLSLDVINDGKNNQIQLARTGEYSGQLWKFTPMPGGFYRITSQWQGEGKSLDVVNDGKNNRLQLADTGDYSGQFWKIIPQGNGYAKLTTQWQGDGKALDVINDGRNNRLQLANSGNYSGQFWKLTKYQPAQPNPQSQPETQSTTSTQTPEKICQSLVRGKVAWNRSGDTSWNENNINRLCQGTQNPQQTVNCFKQGIATHNDWNEAIGECTGNKQVESSEPLTKPAPPSVWQQPTTNRNGEQVCYELVQGKIAWSQGGDRHWQDGNVRKLCAGTSQPHKTVNCFKQGIATHNNWSKAIDECSGSRVADKRVFEVSQIWSQTEANEKCGQVAAQHNGTWTGQWWTTIPGSTSVCEINR